MAGRESGNDPPKASDRRWHAVSVKPGPRACDAAVSGADRRWLSREAPMLPLPGCSRPDNCRCTYQHHDDRRTGMRRVEDIDAFARSPRVGQERRTRKTRRTPPKD
jgi:hypothetical protein